MATCFPKKFTPICDSVVSSILPLLFFPQVSSFGATLISRVVEALRESQRNSPSHPRGTKLLSIRQWTNTLFSGPSPSPRSFARPRTKPPLLFAAMPPKQHTDLSFLLNFKSSTREEVEQNRRNRPHHHQQDMSNEEVAYRSKVGPLLYLSTSPDVLAVVTMPTSAPPPAAVHVASALSQNPLRAHAALP